MKKMYGIMIDISRGQIPKLKTLTNLIKFVKNSKINFLSLYIEHTFKYKKHPIIWKKNGAISPDDIKKLTEFAKKYNIEIIPSIQTLGHFEKILTHKEYAHLAESKFYSSLAISKKETYFLIEDLISEIAKTFNSDYINIGEDEVWDFAQGKSKIYVKKNGGEKKLFLQHILKVREIAKKYNKKIMMWADMFFKYPEIIKKLPDDIIILNWDYNNASVKYFKEKIKALTKNDNLQIICTATSTWDSLFPQIKIYQNNILNFHKAALSFKEKIYGEMLTIWGDDGNFNFLGESYPAISLFKEIHNIFNLNKLKHNEILSHSVQTIFEIKNKKISDIFLFFSELHKHLNLENSYELFKLYWSDPFFKNIILSKNFNIKYIKSLIKKSQDYLNIITKYAPLKNRLIWDEIVYKIILNNSLLRRIEISYYMYQIFEEIYNNLWNEKLVIQNIIKILNYLNYLKRDLKYLRAKYRKIWLKSYKKEGLLYNLRKFDRLINEINEKCRKFKIALKKYKKEGVGIIELDNSFQRVINAINGIFPDFFSF